jgi:hypothetical protein
MLRIGLRSALLLVCLTALVLAQNKPARAAGASTGSTQSKGSLKSNGGEEARFTSALAISNPNVLLPQTNTKSRVPYVLRAFNGCFRW